MLEIYNYTKRYNSFSTNAMVAKASKSDSELVNALFMSGKWKDHRRATRLCNVSTGRVLQLAGGRLRRSGVRAQPKMWEFQVLLRDSGMSWVG